MHTIYGLFDPRDGQLRYIGRTVNPVERFKSHCSLSSYGIQKNGWIIELQKLGLRPDMQELDTTDDFTVYETEKFYISYFKMLGANLTNFNGLKLKRSPARKIKVAMMMRIDEDLLERIDERSASEGISRSAWISQACSRNLK